MEAPLIQTNLLTLRPWQPADAPALFRLLQEPDIFEYFPPSPTPPSLEKAERYINHHIAHWQKFGCGHWAVETPEGLLAGWNGLEYLPETDETEVAYMLGREFRGRGLATAGARLALQFGFERAGLQGIIGLVHPLNAPSIRVLEKCGLRHIDNKVYWGMEMRRYRIEKQEFTP